MTDLVIHIGLPKTGTTSLQNKVFAYLPNYLGISQTYNFLHDRRFDCHKLLDIFTKFSKGRKVDDDILKWMHKVKEINTGSTSTCNNLILSNEYFFEGYLNYIPEFPLVKYRKRKYKGLIPIVQFISKLSELWSDGNVRVILTLRNQPEWIASKYSQATNKILGASQKDFEKRIDNFIGISDPIWADWSEWVRQLQSIAGENNVCVLLIEEMGVVNFWRELGQFLEVDLFQYNDYLKNKQLQNVKRTTNNIWSIQRFRTSKALEKKWPQRSLKCFRYPTLASLRRADQIVSPIITTLITRKRNEYICLTEDLRQKISDYVTPCNKRLSEQLGRDLSGFGY